MWMYSYWVFQPVVFLSSYSRVNIFIEQALHVLCLESSLPKSFYIFHFDHFRYEYQFIATFVGVPFINTSNLFGLGIWVYAMPAKNWKSVLLITLIGMIFHASSLILFNYLWNYAGYFAPVPLNCILFHFSAFYVMKTFLWFM